jgi:hypothetical protein
MIRACDTSRENELERDGRTERGEPGSALSEPKLPLLLDGDTALVDDGRCWIAEPDAHDRGDDDDTDDGPEYVRAAIREPPLRVRCGGVDNKAVVVVLLPSTLLRCIVFSDSVRGNDIPI